VIVVGSQSILGTFREDQLATDATMPVEIDILPIVAPDGEPQYTGWCLDKEDLCVAKLCAFRERTRTSSRHSCVRCSSTARPSSPGSAA
jgi:hypothetical protein